MPHSIIDSLLGTKTTAQQQETVNSGEVHALWSALVMRYDVREMNDVFENFANDVEWKAILAMGKKILDREITQLENEMHRLGIPLPPRPPKSINTPGNTEILRDEFMFRITFMGIQTFLDEFMRAVRMMQNERLRGMLIEMFNQELGVYTKMSTYGRLKGWLMIPPAYHPAGS